MKIKAFCIFLSIILLFGLSVYAAPSLGADNSEKDLIKQTISQYFDIYMDAMVEKDHPDFSDVFSQNENTLLYREIVNYEVDSAVLFETGFSDYSYTLDYDKFDILGNKAEVGLILNADIRFEQAPADLITKRCLAYAFTLEKENDTWKITEINSDHIVFAEFIESLKQSYPSAKHFSVTQIKNEVNNRIGSLKESAEVIKSGRMSEEAKRKLADIEALDTLAKSTGTVIPAAATVSFNKTNAIAYANAYALEGSSSQNRLFYYASNGRDCTNYLSQCVWAGYGGYDGSNLTKTRENISNKYRMVNATGSDWYTKGWFGHTNGGTGPWEQVGTHWTYILDRNKLRGPMGYGYNDGKIYSDFSASSILIGEALQFYNKSKHTTYQHSIFTVRKTANTYGSIYCNAHSGEYKDEPLTTFISAFGGANNCYMRNILYSASTFDN